MSNLGDLALAISPPWLADDGTPVDVPVAQDGIAGRFEWVQGLIADQNLDKCEQGIFARLPLGGTTSQSGGNGGPYDDALALIGADRVIPRGLNETSLGYGKRLQRAHQTWQHAGQAPTVLREVLVYLGANCKAAVVRSSGTISGFATVFPVGADLTQEPSYRSLLWWWDTDEASGVKNGGAPHSTSTLLPCWRTWLVLWSVSPQLWTIPAPVLGSGRHIGTDPNISVGFSSPPGLFKSIKQVIGQWKSQQTWYQWIVVSFDFAFADYGGGAPNDGTWGHASKIATAVNADGNTVPAYVAARGAQQRFIPGIASTGYQGPQTWPPVGPPAFPFY